jgi:hypothetical protein
MVAQKFIFGLAAISAFSLAVQPARSAVININYIWTGSESVQGSQRLNRDAIPSVAGTAKPFPGAVGNNPTYFYFSQIPALPGSVISVNQNAGNALRSFSALYDDSVTFDPSSLATGYLGDAGSSGPSVYSIIAPSGGNVRFVANSTNGTNAIGQPLDATITYTPVPGPLPVFGAAAAWAYSRTVRRRCKASDL